MPGIIKLRISAEARADLAEIDEWGARQFGQKTADDYSRGFKDAFARLREFPQMGPLEPELGEGIRCFTHRRHRLFYRVEDGRVVILRIVHYTMDGRRAIRITM